jgi:hypothetical protein
MMAMYSWDFNSKQVCEVKDITFNESTMIEKQPLATLPIVEVAPCQLANSTTTLPLEEPTLC